MIGFLHLPKTGGTAVRTALEDSGRAVWRPKGPRYRGSVSPGDLTGFDIVTGHLTFAAMMSTHPDKVATVLREPVDRFLSHYYVESGLVERNYWPDVDVVPDNMMCRLLGDADDPINDPPDLDAAIRNLERIDHVGFTQDLAATFAWFKVPQRQARVGRRDKRQTPVWLQDAAYERTRLDAFLYQKAHASHV